MAAKIDQYKLPVFNRDKLISIIQELVDKAPGGVVNFVIDLFCGAGGTSEGIEQARYNGLKNYCIIAGINHDKKAIYSQAVNHPHAYYTDEDIRFANLAPIVELVDLLRRLFPQCPVIVWSSLECTNHSNAKGGLPRDADSRTLPWDMYRYIEAINPDGVWIENVKEFAEWGPMMPRTVLEKGKTRRTLKNPIPVDVEDRFWSEQIEKGYICYCTLQKQPKKKKKKNYEEPQTPPKIEPEWLVIKDLKGTYYLPWLEKVNSYGYHHQERIINAADHGAPTNRHRLFIIFMRKGWPIVFPHPTHAKNPKKNDLFDPGLKPHVPVKTCLNFSVEGRSIFEKGHVESPNTWQRVYDGLVKFVAGGKKEYERMLAQQQEGITKINPAHADAFLIKYMGNDEKTGSNAGLSIEGPANAITAQPRLGLIQLNRAHFITRYNNNPNGTVNKGSSIEDPSPSVLTVPGLGLVSAAFIDTIYGNGFASSPDCPAPTVRTKDGMALVDVKYFLYKAFTNGGSSRSIDEPDGSLTTNPKSDLIKVEGWVMDTHFNNIGSGINEPANTITANRKWSYLINPSWYGYIGSANEPAHTVVARQDKAPLYLVSASKSELSLAIPVFKDDPEIVVKIKEFMALYNIYDIKKRMLMVPELLKIQSFPEGYYLAGSKTDQKKFIGNAVPPVVARAIAESMYWPLVEHIVRTRNIDLKLAA